MDFRLICLRWVCCNWKFSSFHDICWEMAALKWIEFLLKITNKSGIWYITLQINFSFSNSLLIVKFIQFHRMGPNFGFTRWLIFPKQSYRLSWHLVGIKYTIGTWHCAICRQMYTEDLVYGVGETWIQKCHSFFSLVVWTKESLFDCQYAFLLFFWTPINRFCLSWCEPNNQFAAFNMRINYLNFLLRVKLMKSQQIVQTTSGRKKINKERLRSVNQFKERQPKWMNEKANECRKIEERSKERSKHRLMDVRTTKQTNEWMNGSMNRWMNGWMNK